MSCNTSARETRCRTKPDRKPERINTLAGMGESGARAQSFPIADVASGARSIKWPDANWLDDKKQSCGFMALLVSSID